MARGRPRKIQLVHSDTSHRPKRPTAPASGDLPKCPKQLSKLARKKWRAIVKAKADDGTICNLDEGMLAGYCQALADYLECQEFIAANGNVIVMRDDKGAVKWVQADPHVSMARNNLEKVRQLGEQLGLSPKARTGIKAPKKKPLSRRERLLS